MKSVKTKEVEMTKQIYYKKIVFSVRGDPDNVPLLRSLATLFSYQRKYDKSMEVYLRLKHEDVFSLIR